SAGAQDVWVLLASPLAKGLFSRAIVHSGAGLTDTRDNVETSGAAIVAKLGCTGGDVAAWMRSKSASEIVLALPGKGGVGKEKIYVPNIDGWVLTKTPLQSILGSEHNRVPLILGTTSDETMFDFGKVASDADYQKMAHAFYDSRYGTAAVTEML